MNSTGNSRPISNVNELWRHISATYGSLRVVIYFSIFLNILSLAPSIYMLEVYDRVITSRSEVTLLMLTILVLGSYFLHELLDIFRRDVMLFVSKKFDRNLAVRVFHAIHRGNLHRLSGVTLRPLADLRELRTFMGSSAMMSVIDAPISLVFLVIIFAIDYRMGLFSLLGLLVQLFLLWINFRKVYPNLNEAQFMGGMSQSNANLYLRNAQVIESMGMKSAVARIWLSRQNSFLEKQAVASDYAGFINATSKFLQLFQGSAILGLGCWLLINGHGDATGGLIMLTSILSSRLLQPMLILLGSWKMVVDANLSFKRLNQFLALIPADESGMALPPPKGHLSVEMITAGPPNSPGITLKNINFDILPGHLMAITGLSGSGKSSLAKVIVGVWPTMSGSVRLDGVNVYQWNKNELGPFVGYLPQEIELLDGTIAENIARFGDVDLSKVKLAAELVGLNNLIEAMPDGYQSEIGQGGAFFSGGQRQRLGLARAIYGNPKLLVLDEPNSSLDQAGDIALLKTLEIMKSIGTTILVVTHRANIIDVADSLLILNNGLVRACGPKLEVLQALEQANKAAIKNKV